MNSLHFVFDKFPSPDGACFIEVETPEGKSVSVGEWRRRDDGFVEMVVSEKCFETGTVQLENQSHG